MGRVLNREEPVGKVGTARKSISRERRALGLLVATGISLSTLLLILSSLIFEGEPGGSTPWILFSLSLLATLCIAGMVSRRRLFELREEIATLNDFASTIASGNQSTPQASEQVTIGELERVARSIDQMKKKAEDDIEAMRRLEQVRSEFLGNVSHELRTPIFTVQGFLETLLDGAVDDPDVRDEFLQKAHDNLLRLHALLNDLIEISRIESGAMKLSFRYFNLVDLCRGTLHNLSDKAAMNSVTLHLEVEGGDAEGRLQVYADRKRVEQALVNLLDNAIKYNRPDGEVILRIAPDNGSVRLSVSDNGPGIAPEHIDRIFERFYRVDKGRSREVGGSGLGLAIVKHIVEAHGSTIEVVSDGESGTTFSFQLPRFD